MTAHADEALRERPTWLAEEARAALLINPASGGVLESHADVLPARLAAFGVKETQIFGVEDLDALIENRGAFDLIIVFGGDGTARAAAAAMPSDAPPMLLLPGGTLNVLPKTLLGDLSWADALEAAFARGEVTRLVGGTANGEAFFIAAMFGAPTLLARAREAVREGRWARAVKRARLFFRRAFFRRVAGKPDGLKTRRAEAIGILCPSFSGKIEGDALEWVHFNARNMLEFMRVGFHALDEGWRSDPAIEICACARGVVSGPRLIPAILDGEPKSFSGPVRIQIQPRGPCVIALPGQLERAQTA